MRAVLLALVVLVGCGGGGGTTVGPNFVGQWDGGWTGQADSGSLSVSIFPSTTIGEFCKITGTMGSVLRGETGTVSGAISVTGNVFYKVVWPSGRATVAGHYILSGDSMTGNTVVYTTGSDDPATVSLAR